MVVGRWFESRRNKRTMTNKFVHFIPNSIAKMWGKYANHLFFFLFLFILFLLFNISIQYLFIIQHKKYTDYIKSIIQNQTSE